MSTAQAAARPSPLAVFRHRNFSLVWTAELVSTIGNSFTAIASGILIYRLTDSAFAVGLMLTASILPGMIVGLIAGVYVDRADRRRVMMICDLIRGVLTISIPFFIAFSVWILFAIVFISAIVETFFECAKESVMPELAPDEELEAANSLFAISSFGSTAIGFGAAGLLASVDINLAFVIDAATFFLSAATMTFVRLPPMEISDEPTNVQTVVRNLREGIGYLLGNAVLRSLLVVAAIYSLSVGLWNTLLLPFSLTALKATEFEYGLQEGLTSVGFVIGSLLLAGYANRLFEGQWLAISLIGSAVTGIAYGLATNVWFAIGVVAVAGVFNAPYGVARQTLMQRNTTREVRGRVSGAFYVVGSFFFVPGMLAAGLADVIDIRLLIVIVGALWGVAGVLALVLPGLARPAAEWRRSIALLGTAPGAPGLAPGRPATLVDLDRLLQRLPMLAGLGAVQREALLAGAMLREADSGSSVVRMGEASDAVYFVIEGRLVAGAPIDGQERLLSVMNAGDFFGEIAALTGRPRTANVIAEDDSTLLEIPAETFRGLLGDPAIDQVVRATMAERLGRTGLADLPRFSGIDETSRRSLLSDASSGSGDSGAPEVAPA